MLCINICINHVDYVEKLAESKDVSLSIPVQETAQHITKPILSCPVEESSALVTPANEFMTPTEETTEQSIIMPFTTPYEATNRVSAPTHTDSYEGFFSAFTQPYQEHLVFCGGVALIENTPSASSYHTAESLLIPGVA